MLLPKDRGFVHRPSVRDHAARPCSRAGARCSPGRGAMAALGRAQACARRRRATTSAALPGTRSTVPGAVTMDKPTPTPIGTSYNNFYEFGTDKSDPAQHAHTLKTRPWTVAIEGEVKKPDDDRHRRRCSSSAPMEERIYRLRCVEGWSMVIPWVGYSLSELIRRVEPTGNAKFVQFVTLADHAQMPGLRRRCCDWPYVEGLRIDEAMHPLTLLAFGMYGEVLPNQNGAPVRLVVPWKYGFKSGKSIVKIRFVEQAARDQLGARGAAGVRLLLQREPEGRPPALEPGHRAPHRRGRPVRQEAADADVQRLRGRRSASCTPAWTCKKFF